MARLSRLLSILILPVIAWVSTACAPAIQAGNYQNRQASATNPITAVSTASTIPTTSAATDRPASLAGATLAGGITPSPSSSPTQSSTPNATPTLAPKAWRMAPVIPTSVSQHMREVYQLGQSLGHNPGAFSKVGDCQTMLPDFLGDFATTRYNLGEYTYLQPVVDNFAASFGRNSRAVKDGLTASGAMATLWNTWKDCNVEETPLECEYRLNNPSFAIISLGTNDANGLLPFEDTLREVIDVTLQHAIVPILVTKADNAEGDWSINATIMQLAYEYQIPLWNFWLAVQPLPLHGLRSPEHLTYGEYVISGDFSTAANMQYAYNLRNLTALQVLDTVWRSVTGAAPSAFTPTPFSSLP